MRTILLLLFSLAFTPITNAVVVFQGSAIFAQAVGWRIRAVVDIPFIHAYRPKWNISELAFYTDASCVNEVDISNGSIISSDLTNDAAANAFDKNSSTVWASDTSWGDKIFWIGYNHGPNVEVKCIKLVQDTLRPHSDFIIGGLEVQSYDALHTTWLDDGWRDVYQVEGLTVGTNIINLTEACTEGPMLAWGDGDCDMFMNNSACDWDGGDCHIRVAGYPGCDVDRPDRIGNGVCDEGRYNSQDCGWDGGDCNRQNDFITIAGVFLVGTVMVISCCCCWSCYHRRPPPEPRMEVENGGRRSPATATTTDHFARAPIVIKSDKQKQEERKLLILGSIIRKVCMNTICCASDISFCNVI